MKLNKIMITALLTMSVCSVASANQGGGKVTFNGSIIDAPCSVHPDSADQTVELGQVSNALLKKLGSTSIPQRFSIKLENCDFGTPAAKNKVTVTFTGQEVPETKGKHLAIIGTGSGAGVGIKDGKGGDVTLGTAIAAQELSEGSNELSFSGHLQGIPKKVGDKEEVIVTPGDFTAVANFQLAYQ